MQGLASDIVEIVKTSSKKSVAYRPAGETFISGPTLLQAAPGEANSEPRRSWWLRWLGR